MFHLGGWLNLKSRRHSCGSSVRNLPGCSKSDEDEGDMVTKSRLSCVR